MPTMRRLKKIVVDYGFWFYSLALVGILVFHYSTPSLCFLDSFPLTRRAAVYILFLVPVAGATYLFGQRGGLVTLIFAVLVMLSRFPSVLSNRVDALMEVIAISFVGYMLVLILACLRRNVSRLRAINASHPPICSAHLRPSIASSTAIIDGVLMVSPRKMPSINLPPLVRRNIFGMGQGGV